MVWQIGTDVSEDPECNTEDGGSRHHILLAVNNIHHYEQLGSHTEGTLESNFIVHNIHKT
jgi:hypothetical protein